MSSQNNKVNIDTKTFVRFWLVILGFGLAGFLLFKALPALLIIGAALFLALAISPLINKISDLLPSKGRTFSITTAYVIVVGFIIAFVAIVAPTIINETVKFISNLPSMMEANSGFIDNISTTFGIEDAGEQLSKALSSFSNGFLDNLGNIITTSITGLTSAVTAGILILVLSLFMLIEGPGIIKRFWGHFSGNPDAKRAGRVINRMGLTISKYVSNAITVGIFNACFTALAVFLISLFFNFTPGLALPFGLLTGVFSLIPMFGSLIGGAIVAVLLGFNALPAGIIFMIYTIIYLQIESNVISPKVQGKGLQLPALVVLGSVTIGVYTFGLVGAIVAIPIAACLKILLEEYGSDINLPGQDSKDTPIKAKQKQNT